MYLFFNINIKTATSLNFIPPSNPTFEKIGDRGEPQQMNSALIPLLPLNKQFLWIIASTLLAANS